MSKHRDIMSFMSKSKVTKIKSLKSKNTIKESQVLIATKIDDAAFDEWTIIGSHLLYRIPPTLPYLQSGPLKIASFDLDGTIIRPTSGGTFAKGPNDWTWNTKNTFTKLILLRDAGFLIVIFTNQGAVVARRQNKSLVNLITKLNKVRESFDDMFIFASTKRPKNGVTSSEEEHLKYRKPGSGMWKEFISMVRDVNREVEIDMESSFYCGDAAGRAGDFSDSDKKFAENVGLKFFTPEECLN